MSINTYGLPEDEYTEVFKKKAGFTFRLFQTFKGMAFSEGVNLESYSDKFIFDVFQDVLWTTDETIRENLNVKKSYLEDLKPLEESFE